MAYVQFKEDRIPYQEQMSKGIESVGQFIPDGDEDSGLKAGAWIGGALIIGIVIVGLFLTGCSNRIENPSQASAMEREGLERTEYTYGMDLVPCIKWTNNDPRNGTPVPLTVKERVTIQQAKGGYMADCGVVDDVWVWG